MIKPIDGLKPLGTNMQVDPRLFKEGGTDTNRLHAIMDLQTSLWYLKFEKGSVPTSISGRYTGFRQLFEHAKRYYEMRNIEIIEIKD